MGYASTVAVLLPKETYEYFKTNNYPFITAPDMSAEMVIDPENPEKTTFVGNFYNCVKWYGPEVEAFTNYLATNNIPYSFLRVGEEAGDIERNAYSPDLDKLPIDDYFFETGGTGISKEFWYRNIKELKEVGREAIKEDYKVGSNLLNKLHQLCDALSMGANVNTIVEALYDNIEAAENKVKHLCSAALFWEHEQNYYYGDYKPEALLKPVEAELQKEYAKRENSISHSYNAELEALSREGKASWERIERRFINIEKALLEDGNLTASLANSKKNIEALMAETLKVARVHEDPGFAFDSLLSKAKQEMQEEQRIEATHDENCEENEEEFIR